jgi:hypothetical protein
MGRLGDSRLLIKAARGDREAIAKVTRQSLPKVREKIEEARDTIQHYQATEWDAEARRREAMSGEVDPQAGIAAAEELYGRVLGVTHLFPLVLIAQGEEREVYEEKLGDNVYNLLLAFHNPTIRYALVGAVDESAREDVDALFGAIGAEVWGTLLATTDSGDLTLDDFPEGTREVLEEISASVEDMEAER